MQNTKKSAVSSIQYSMVLSSLLVFIFGFIAGVTFTVWKMEPKGENTDKTTVKTMSQNKQGTSSIAAKREQNIEKLQKIVAAEPDNAEAWYNLANMYYDLDKPQRAITAYNKVIELQKPTANLLTDLGIMYRRIGQFDKAIRVFDKAIAMDTQHLPSRFNKGVVLFHDLNRQKEAITSWQSIVKIDPNARMANGELVADMIHTFQAEQQK